MIPNLEARVLEGSEDDVVSIAEMVDNLVWFICVSTSAHRLSQLQKGISSARSDDTKSLKGPILDWIVPSGQALTPPLARNVKIDRGFHHERTGALLCPAGMDWSNLE